MTATAADAAPRVKRPYRPKTTDEMVAGVRRQIRGLEARAMDEEPSHMPPAMLELAAEMEDAAVRVVARMRMIGYRWDDIAAPLGLSKQACFNRYGIKAAAWADGYQATRPSMPAGLNELQRHWWASGRAARIADDRAAAETAA